MNSSAGDDELKSKSHITKMIPVGLWHVTTEGDCEGRSVKDLGYHKGHIIDIAHKLSGENYYSLHFEAGVFKS